MYGSEKTDLVVKYYDLAFGISGEAEMAWYLDKVRSYGGPVLDLACGTGRMALLLAKEGYEVTGIDQSEGMLNQFRQKLGKHTADVRGRIHMQNQSMSGFDLGRQFNTILCCDAFFHNLTVEDQLNCLRKVAKHLTPDGHFVFNLPNPTCEYIQKCTVSDGRIYEQRGRYQLADGETLLVEQSQAVNVKDQCIFTTLRFSRQDCTGKSVELGESTWITRYLFRYEAVHLLYRCGFTIDSLVGDYRNGPVTEKGQLIFDTRLRIHSET